jgi:hypothetical protein
MNADVHIIGIMKILKRIRVKLKKNLHKLWFVMECWEILGQLSEVKLQWLQDPGEGIEIIWTLLDLKLVDLPGTKKSYLKYRIN